MVTDERTRTGHPVPAAVRALAAGAGELAARPVFVLDAPATRETLLELSDLQARLDAYELAVAAHADEVAVGADTGCTSTGVWWALATRQRRRSMVGLVTLATSVETRWDRVQQGLAGARMNLGQARVVVRALWRTSPRTSTRTWSTGPRSCWWGTRLCTTRTSSPGWARTS